MRYATITPVKKILRVLRKLRPYFPQTAVNYLYHLPKAMIASWMYGNPGADLEIIAVTGTDGKTTTASLIYHILKTARKKVALISTVDARMGRKKIKTGFHVTSPSPFALHSLLRRMRSQKIRYIVLEVTSHGIDQFRIYPLIPNIAVLTNITHEHLDYHKTFERYQATKLKLFKKAQHAVVNKDLPNFASINASLPNILFSTYSLHTDSQLQPTNIKYSINGTQFSLGKLTYTTPLLGEFNLYNTLAAISAALLLEVHQSDIKRALMSFPGIAGRMEKIENKRGIRAYVDFAHTPNALKEVLSTINTYKKTGEKVIVVFGAASERDETKRPIMGRIAGELADRIILTTEDSRSEDPKMIAQMILTGASETDKKKFVIQTDRSKAIDQAVNTYAQKGDWVVVCGKGHEESMNLDGFTETPWSDREALRDALEKKT